LAQLAQATDGTWIDFGVFDSTGTQLAHRWTGVWSFNETVMFLFS
jgi:hypothetical protein